MLNQLKQAVEHKVVQAQQVNVVRPEASGEDATRPSGGVPVGTHHPFASGSQGNRWDFSKHGLCRCGGSRD